MASILACLSFVVIFMISTSQCCLLVVEKGNLANIQCYLADNVTSITFQLLTGSTGRDISICDFANNNCTDFNSPAGYYGHIVPPAANKTMVLNITSARINETEFQCVSDDTILTGTCALVVYAWPSKPSCSHSINRNYIEFSCTTTNVYPDILAVLHRQGPDFTDDDVDYNNTKCVEDGSDVDGTFNYSCVWRVPMEKMFYGYKVWVEMYTIVTNVSLGNINPSFSDYITPYLAVPVVQVRDCPVDPQVVTVRIGAQANCTCQLTQSGFPAGGFAEWVTSDMTPVGIPTRDGSSILTLSYNVSDPSPRYQCRPVPPFKANIRGVYITAKFTSSAPPSVITGLQTVVILLGALGSVIVSRLP